MAGKTIDTLVEDIRNRLVTPGEVPDEASEAFATGLKQLVVDRLSKPRTGGTLRMSNLGVPCERKLWYTINTPEFAEKLGPAATMKFMIGDIVEHVLLLLAKLAGHTVTDEQKEVTLHGVKGHIDARIDGHLVDAKSASPYSFNKFASGLKPSDDSFGYLSQLGSYAATGGDGVASFLVVNKVLGHITLDTHEIKQRDWEKIILDKREMLSKNFPPQRGYSDVPEGKSGNRKLDTVCSYCPFKRTCWGGLRAYRYSRGPVFFTRIVREPEVPEINLTTVELDE